MPRKYTKKEKTKSGRQGLDWTDPKSFETAAKRIAKSYNSFVSKELGKTILEDQLENIKSGLGYMKKFDTTTRTWKNDPSRMVFDAIYTIDKDGKLQMKKYDKGENVAQKIFEEQASKNKTKVVDDRGNPKVIDDKRQQRIRTLYESTPTATEYLNRVKEDVEAGYSDFSLDAAEREVLRGTIKETAKALQEKNPHVDDKAAYDQAKKIITTNREAIQKELEARAKYDKTDTDEIGNLYKKISEAIENGLLEGEDLARADAIIHHSGYQSTFSDINELQGIVNMF